MHSKHNRGLTNYDRDKRRKAAVESLVTKLTCTNVARNLTSDDLEKHDIAAECAHSQQQLADVSYRLHKYDMKTIFLMASRFDPSNPAIVSGPYTDILTQYLMVTMEQAGDWKSCLNQCASAVDVESMEWCREFLENSMDAELKAQVNDDMDDLEIGERGPITIYKSMTSHMVASNQESRDALEEFIRNFSILKYDGENVTNGVMHCKAVV